MGALVVDSDNAARIYGLAPPVPMFIRL